MQMSDRPLLQKRPADRKEGQNGVPGYSLMRDYFNQLFTFPRGFQLVNGDFA